MTTAIRIRELISFGPFKEARGRQEKARRKLDDLMAEAAAARVSGHTMLPAGLADKARQAEAELQGATIDEAAAARDAIAIMQAELVNDPAYRRQISDTLAGLVEANKAAIEFEGFRQAAGRNGATPIPLPDFAANEVRELCHWTKELRRRNLIDVAAIPPALAALMPEVSA